MLLKKPSFYLAIIGIFVMFKLVRSTAYRPPAPPPLVEPSRSPFAVSVAATGIIESVHENVKIAAPRAGLVSRVHVVAGTKVKKGDTLFELDSREARAKVATTRSQLASIRAELAMEQVQAEDLRDQLSRVTKLSQDKVASEDERLRKEFGLRAAEARLAKTAAEISTSESLLQQAEVELSVLTVAAPRGGTVLQVNVREGENSTVNPSEGLMLLGDTERLQVRAEVDEQNAPRVIPNQPAVAFLKGTTGQKIELRFVRIEPFVIPKRSLTGDSLERVDTRVLQSIFEFDRPSFQVYVGQQVDVFIKGQSE